MSTVVTDFGQPRLVLAYKHQGLDHTVGVRLLHGVDPLNSADMTAEAVAFASSIATAMPLTATIYSAYTQSRFGLKLIELDLGAEVEGTHTASGGGRDLRSLTFTISGRSSVVSSAGHVGHTLVRWYIGNIYNPSIGERKATVASVDTSGSLLNYLTSSTQVFADFYGNKCIAALQGSLQFNAYIQRKYGA